MLIEKILAGLVVLVCAVLFARLLLGERRRRRFDDKARRAWFSLRVRTLHLWRWRSTRRAAERAADQAIRKAREGVKREGNVYKPDSFRERRKRDDKLH